MAAQVRRARPGPPRRGRGRMPLLALLLALLLAPVLRAQLPPGRDAADLQAALDRLQVLGSVLYLAAHPDDENPALLAWFSRGRGLRTGYLSLTRGEGGQNRIGTERGDALGALRTQELLAARRLDGAEQYFTRALDFGYSKSADETLAIWDREAVLGDVVRVIRALRPDVVVTRFPPVPGGTHGHHTASAILAVEAFRAAGDPARFPGPLEPWQPRRLVWNRWRRPADQAAPPPPGSLALDAGTYLPLLGRSCVELGAESHSQHRSQAFGEVPLRGPRWETFELLAGEPARADLFEGVDLTWGRLPGGERVAAALAAARARYRPGAPAAILPDLLQAKAAMDALAADPRVRARRAELLEAIRLAAGLWIEAMADRQTVAPGEPLRVTATAIARSGPGVVLDRVELAGQDRPGAALAPNVPARAGFDLALAPGSPCSQPYWCGPGAGPAVHPPGAPGQAGRPEGDPPLAATFHLSYGGVPFDLEAPVRFRVCDPVRGERWQPLAVAPAVRVALARTVELWPSATPRAVQLTLSAGGVPAEGRLRILAGGGWRPEPAELPFRLGPGEERTVAIRLAPPARPGAGTLEVRVVTAAGDEPARGLVRIDHPHVPLQTLFPPARARLVRLDLKTGGRRIGYVAGSGDDIPASLRPLGYQVDLLGDADLAGPGLDRFAAVVVGIRAFNTRPALARLDRNLLDYAARGGTVVVLYQVDQGLVIDRLGPFPFRVTSARVTDETAPVRFLAPDHPLLRRPNRITAADFEGWVQERGTYFAGDWDRRYVPVLAMADPGEAPQAGALLAARHGRGWFVYTGLGFFRQLPEGVPGAYRLFANLLALGGEGGMMRGGAARAAHSQGTKY